MKILYLVHMVSLARLKEALDSEGHTVIRLGRDFNKPIQFNDVDAVIHLAGENIAEGAGMKLKKSASNESINGYSSAVRAIGTSEHKPSVFISASATGFYGDTGSEVITESSPSSHGFLPEVCVSGKKQQRLPNKRESERFTFALELF